MPRLSALRPYLTGLLIALPILVGVWTVPRGDRVEAAIAATGVLSELARRLPTP